MTSVNVVEIKRSYTLSTWKEFENQIETNLKSVTKTFQCHCLTTLANLLLFQFISLFTDNFQGICSRCPIILMLVCDTVVFIKVNLFYAITYEHNSCIISYKFSSRWNQQTITQKISYFEATYSRVSSHTLHLWKMLLLIEIILNTTVCPKWCIRSSIKYYTY